MLDVCLLGCSGTFPLPGRPLSALLLRLNGRLILVDCGEGTQVPMRQLGWGFRALDAILITHFHADHVGGLPGLLLTLGNAERDTPVSIYGPPGLRRIVRGLRTIAPVLPYSVRCHELGERPCISAAGASVSWLPLEHRVPCLGYRFDVPRTRPFLPDRARALGLPVATWKRLQQGSAVRFGSRTVQPDEVLGPPRPGLSVAFITDTSPFEALAPFVAGVDLLVCEATYGDEADRPKARERGHMVIDEAADLARRAKVKRLWLTHFSAAIPDPSVYLDRARAIFPATELGHERKTISLRFED